MLQTDDRLASQTTFQVLDPVWIPMRDGTRLAARIWLPDSASHTPAAVVLEYLPYRRRDGTMARDELTHACWQETDMSACGSIFAAMAIPTAI